MTLAPCRACGQWVSSDARACPHCGARARRRFPLGKALLLLLAALVVMIPTCYGIRVYQAEQAEAAELCRLQIRC
jgi:hypothetical protein